MAASSSGSPASTPDALRDLLQLGVRFVSSKTTRK